MQWFKVVDGGNPDGTAKDRVGLTAGTTYLAKYWNDNFFNIFNALINAGYTLIDDDLSQVTKAFRGGYNATYTYNTSTILTQSVNDVVLGSDGIYYECLTNGTTGDNPVGSVTGNWSVYLDPNIATSIHAATAKPTPVDADEFVITDSAATFGLKKLTLGNLKTALGKGVRQTVQNASVSSTGYANYITIGTGLSVNIAATTIPVKIHSAGGDISLDRLGTISANTTIPGLTASAINYLIATVATDGTIALGKTVLEPIYQFAGTPSVVLDQYTFNIAEMKMYVGNGTTASQVWAVCIGRAITDATTVTNLVNFSLNGRFITPASALLVGATSTGVNHWIGHNLLAVTPILTCLVAQAGYSIGDELPLNIVDSTGNLAVSIGSSSYSCSYSTNVATLYLVTRGASTYTAITPANFNVKFKVTRGW